MFILFIVCACLLFSLGFTTSIMNYINIYNNKYLPYLFYILSGVFALFTVYMFLIPSFFSISLMLTIFFIACTIINFLLEDMEELNRTSMFCLILIPISALTYLAGV